VDDRRWNREVNVDTEMLTGVKIKVAGMKTREARGNGADSREE